MPFRSNQALTGLSGVNFMAGFERYLFGLKGKPYARAPPHDSGAGLQGLTKQAVCLTGTGAAHSRARSICSTPVFLILTLDKMW